MRTDLTISEQLLSRTPVLVRSVLVDARFDREGESALAFKLECLWRADRKLLFTRHTNDLSTQRACCARRAVTREYINCGAATVARRRNDRNVAVVNERAEGGLCSSASARACATETDRQEGRQDAGARTGDANPRLSSCGANKE